MWNSTTSCCLPLLQGQTPPVAFQCFHPYVTSTIQGKPLRKPSLFLSKCLLATQGFLSPQVTLPRNHKWKEYRKTWSYLNHTKGVQNQSCFKSPSGIQRMGWVVREGEDYLSDAFLPSPTAGRRRRRRSPYKRKPAGRWILSKVFLLWECCPWDPMMKAHDESPWWKHEQKCVCSFTVIIGKVLFTASRESWRHLFPWIFNVQSEGNVLFFLRYWLFKNCHKSKALTLLVFLNVFMKSLHRTYPDKDNVKLTLQNHLFLFLPHICPFKEKLHQHKIIHMNNVNHINLQGCFSYWTHLSIFPEHSMASHFF